MRALITVQKSAWYTLLANLARSPENVFRCKDENGTVIEPEDMLRNTFGDNGFVVILMNMAAWKTDPDDACFGRLEESCWTTHIEILLDLLVSLEKCGVISVK